MPAWGRIPIRVICTIQYLVLGLLSAWVSVNNPRAMAALVGPVWFSWVAGITAGAFIAGAVAHFSHNWLVERAVLPVAIFGWCVLDAMLWVSVSLNHSDPASATLVLIVILGLIVRALSLEVFASQHRPTWRTNDGRA